MTFATWFYRGSHFRKDYSNLAMLCATLPTSPVVALTATASKTDIVAIKESLNLRNPVEITANPDRPNIFYEKVFRRSRDLEFFEELLHSMATEHELKKKKLDYPLTIMYLQLKWCGFAFKYLSKHLGNEQYYSENAEPIPENRLLARYHSPQTIAIKRQILSELSSPSSKLRVIFATVALGMGIDVPSIRHVIHVGPPQSTREYFQETGRAGRDGKQATDVLHYNNHDIALSRQGISDNVREYCKLIDNKCLRNFLLGCLDFYNNITKVASHDCCSNCKTYCNCSECTVKNNIY